MAATFEPGGTVLNYRIVDKLGEGGMGVVWKAVDTSLDRTVALKLLPESFGDDPERLARFEREARSLAALNHPNVASLFGMHEHDGTRFITMECVDGEDLAQRIARGALPADELVPIAIGIAEALEAAHAQGIVHRDLKPANVVLAADGTPKVLDFGLAKSEGPADASGGASADASPTMTSLGTAVGMLVGTAAYMSPEQARGKPVDRRGDIWALGCILYEGLTGRAPFAGETISDTLAGVLKSEPDWEALPASTPPALSRIARRCLSKPLRERFQDVGDVRWELERALEAPAVEAAPPAPRSNARLAIGAIALLVAGAAVGFGLRALTGGATTDAGAPPARTVSALPAAEGSVFNVKQLSLALSPDGEQLAYIARDADGVTRLHLRLLADASDRALPRTEGATRPFWSPDGEQIGFYVGTTLMRIGPSDAQPRAIAEVASGAFSWSSDGTILGVGRGQAFQRIDVADGTIETIETGLEALIVEDVHFLPDGKHYLLQFWDYDSDRPSGVRIGSLGSDEHRPLIATASNVQYSDGQLIYLDGARILAQPFDLERLELTGEPVVVAEPVFRLSYPRHGFFTAARDRARLIFLEGDSEGLRTELVWFDRAGAILERTGITGDLYNPALSADGRRVALDISTEETDGDIWVHDLARGSSRQLTADPADESNPVWSSDEKSIYFYRGADILRADLAGSTEPAPVYDGAVDTSNLTHDVTRDGTVIFSAERAARMDLWLLDTASGAAEPWADDEAYQFGAELSPDEQWLAYQSDETGRVEVYIERFPDRSERFRVSPRGGSNPSWRADGRELYFVSPNDEIVAVPLDLSADREPIGKAEVLFRTNLRRDMFAPAADGERFLVVQRLDPGIDRAVLVDGWGR